MSQGKSIIGLTWDPKLPSLPSSSSSKTTVSDKNLKPVTETTALWKPNSQLVDGLYVPPNDPKKLNKLFNKQIKDTAGTNWFDMPAQTITLELKKDLQLLKLRSVADPKRFYKKDSKMKNLPKYFQMGTVVECASEYFSARLTKKERKASVADEMLADQHHGQFRKRKVTEIEEQNRPGGVDKWNNKGKQSWKRAKQRRR